MDCEALAGTSEIVMGVASTSWIGTSAVITSSGGLCFSTEVYVSDVLDVVSVGRAVRGGPGFLERVVAFCRPGSSP